VRVLWFNWRCWVNPQAGGAEVHVKEVSKRWVEMGHEVTLFCAKYEGCKEREELDGVEIIRRGYPYTVYLFAVEEYLRSLRKKTYDMVIDDINGVPFFTPLYIKKPKVAIMHHLVRDIFFRELALGKALLGYTAEQMIPSVYRNTPFAAVSESTKEDLIRFGIPRTSIRVVHNGIDQELFKPNPCLRSSYPHVVYLGRIKRYKNLDQLLIAFSRVVDRFKKEEKKNIKLTIAGRGDYAELKNIAERLDIVSNVDFQGEISDQEKVKLLQSAWVYVTTSTREGWGLTAVEAMACGTPVIGYDVPGLRDSIIDCETGFLIPYGNVERLAELVSMVLYDDMLKKRLSENAHKWSMNFNWGKTAKELIDFIENYS
jgi:glycosyltransferase involved in cell wall biosynthesis